ncbi:MAG: hypothetical protein ACRD04_13695 [Terriglobales bacterium]
MFPKTLTLGIGLAALAGAAAAQALPAPATAAPTASWLQASISAASLYDSNIRQNNALPVAGWTEELGGEIAAQQQHATAGWSLNYQPWMQWFTVLPGLDSLNQSAQLQAWLQPAPGWRLQGQMDGGYWEQLPAAQVAAPAPPGAAPAGPLLPSTREASGAANLQLSYALSPVSSLAAYGSYNVRRFPGAGAASALSGARNSQTGLLFLRALSPTTQWGVRLEEQNGGIGAYAHVAAESVTLSWAHAFTPLTRLTAYAGPEYSQVHATYTLSLPVAGLPLTITDRMYRVRTEPRFGGSLAHDSQSCPWNVRVDRQVSNGGGALPFPVALTSGSLALQPQLKRQWRLRLGVRAAQYSALTSGLLASRVRMAAMSAGLSRPLGRQLNLEFEWGYEIQRSSGTLPLSAAVNRGIGGVRLSWQWPSRPWEEEN